MIHFEMIDMKIPDMIFFVKLQAIGLQILKEIVSFSNFKTLLAL